MMRKTNLKKALSFLLCIALIAAMALFATGCSGKKTAETVDGTTVYADGDVVGEGAKQFTLVIADKDGNETRLEIHTDKDIVGEALLDNQVVAGEDSQYGLYVKTVNGITADFDTDGVYWAFYIDGEYAMTGVDATEITEGVTYSLRVE
ncbi:MAG: DUF4430 domain-containing protein [Candidatus Avoscillospira sp.]